MCAIIDNNVKGELLEDDKHHPGYLFRSYIESGKLQLVIGGTRLKNELLRGSLNSPFNHWIKTHRQAGQVLNIDDDLTDAKEQEIKATGGYKSDDEHILALAKSSGARLLYSNDTALHKDFRNSRILARPRGSIYSTLESRSIDPIAHRRLLQKTKLCRK